MWSKIKGVKKIMYTFTKLVPDGKGLYSYLPTTLAFEVFFSEIARFVFHFDLSLVARVPILLLIVCDVMYVVSH